MRGIRPPEAPADFVERDCSNPTCERTVWIPPGAESAAQEMGTPFLSVCSATCAKLMAEVLGETQPITVVDGQTKTLPHTIDEMFCFIASDDHGEGIPSITLPGLGVVPLLGADMDRIASLRPHAEHIAKMSGKTIKLVKFTHRVELEELG